MTGKNYSLAERAWVAFLAVVASLFRFLPYAAQTPTWNLSPVGSVGIYGGSRLGGWLAFVLPLGIMAASDVVLWAWLGFQPFNPVVYGCFLIYVLLGYGLLQKPTAWRVGGVALLGGVQFFLITNFAVWVTSCVPAATLGGAAWAEFPSTHANYTYSMLQYSADLNGLLACYWFALPFFARTLAGDLLFCYVLFGIHAWLIKPACDLEPGLAPEQAA